MKWVVKMFDFLNSLMHCDERKLQNKWATSLQPIYNIFGFKKCIHAMAWDTQAIKRVHYIMYALFKVRKKMGVIILAPQLGALTPKLC